MLIILSCWAVLAQLTVAFHQSDYEVVHHRLELISYNRSYLRNTKVSLVPFNRTVRAINSSFDLLIDITRNSIPMSLQAFKLSANDYRPFPFFLNSDYCKMRVENLFGINDMAMHSNMPPCPIKKGHYYINKYRPDESKFPPHLFPGEWKAAIKFTYGSDSLAEVYWYGTIHSLEKV